MDAIGGIEVQLPNGLKVALLPKKTRGGAVNFAERLLGGKDVVGASRRLEARHGMRSGARNGLRASSVPSVVSGPWPE